MRSALLAAAAAAPLALAAMPAFAQTTVSTSTSTPLSTSTAGDVTITTGGTITLNASGPAVTVDSNNSVTNQGSINSDNLNNVTGIQLEGGHSGMINNTGAISLTEDYTAQDTANGDGIAEAPFAQGQFRFGIHLLPGAAPFVGDINSSAGAINVKGDGSYGVLLEAPLQGNLGVGSSVSLTGDGGAGVRETAGVTGGVTISGAVAATGAQSSAVVLNGDVGGHVSIYNALTSTGYSTTVRPAAGVSLQDVETTPADVQQGGSALVIGANVAGGVFLGAAGTATTDTDGDGIPDVSEGSAAVVTYGSAPAVVVGAVGRSVTLSNYDTGLNPYGLIVRGTISGQGVFDGVTATGLQIGVAGGGPVNLSGGLLVTGSITSGTYAADTNAVHILAGSTLGAIANEGTLQGTIAASNTAVTARGVLIDAGANVSTLSNFGLINGSAVGDSANAAALVDNSGTLSRINNSGTISAALVGTTNGLVTDTPTGTRTALDLSANTGGVTLVQQGLDSSGAAPSIVGDVLLGSGPNTVQILAGTVTGALSLGSNTATSLTVDTGGVYTGALSYGGTGLALTVGGQGTLSLTAANPLKLSTLNVASGGVLRFAVDAANDTASTLTVAGAANIATGAKIGLNVLTTPNTPQTLTLVSSNQLNLGAVDSTQINTLPFLISATLSSTPTSLDVTVVRRSAADLGLNASEAPALDGVTTGVNSSPALSAALLGQTTQAGFASTFRQLLPDRGEGVMRFAENATRQVGEATAEADDFADGGHAWVQQLVLGFQQDADATHERVEGGGYGAAGGFQTDQGPFGAFGVTGMFAIGTTDDKSRPASTEVNVTDLEGGVYWRARLGGFRLEARGGGGYLWMHGTRGVSIAATDTSAAFSSISKDDRNGYEASGRFGGSYQLDLGRFYLRPQAHVDYFHINEDGYTETGGGSGVDLSVASRSASMTSGVGSLEFGTRFGSPDALTWRPSVEVGVRDVFDGDTGALTAGFGSTTGPSAFTLSPLSLKGTNTLAKVKLSAAGRGFDFDFVASGEERSTYKEGEVRAVARFSF